MSTCAEVIADSTSDSAFPVVALAPVDPVLATTFDRSLSTLAMFTCAVRCWVVTPPTFAVPTMWGSVSQVLGLIPSAESTPLAPVEPSADCGVVLAGSS